MGQLGTFFAAVVGITSEVEVVSEAGRGHSRGRLDDRRRRREERRLFLFNDSQVSCQVEASEETVPGRKRTWIQCYKNSVEIFENAGFQTKIKSNQKGEPSALGGSTGPG